MARTVFAKGMEWRAGKRLVLDIDQETFTQIVDYACSNEISVSKAVRELVEIGIEAVAAK